MSKSALIGLVVFFIVALVYSRYRDLLLMRSSGKRSRKNDESESTDV